MRLVKAFSKALKDVLNERGLTQYQLFKISGVPQSTISTILSGENKTIKLSTIYSICAGLNIELSQFFDRSYLKLEQIND